jgi:signal transduction histidine kinase
VQVIKKISGTNNIFLKISFVILLFILIGAIFYRTSSISVNRNYEALLDQAIDYQELNAINNFFRYPENIVNILSKNKDLPTYEADDRLLKISIMSLFESIVIGDPRISNIYYISKYGEVISYKSKNKSNTNYTQTNWFRRVVEAKPQINWISHKSDFTDADVISCMHKVVDQEGKVIGVTGLDIELFKLSENIKIGNSGYSMVLDSENKIIVHPNYNYLGQYISGNEFINSINSAKGKSFILEINNENFKCKVLHVDRLPSWKFVNAIPMSEINFDIATSMFWQMLLAIGCLAIVLVIYLKNKATHELKQKLTQANEKLKEYSSTIEELAVSRERNRMARDVHDTIGQTLSMLMTLLQVSIVSCKKDSKGIEENLNNAVKITKEGLNEIRRSISGLVPEKLEGNSLYDALNSLVTDFESLGMKVELSVNKMGQNVDALYSEVIYRICQEALTNSVKHGKATEVNIIIKFIDSVIKLFIFDNGLGCKSKSSGNGFGLKGMKQRVETLNGVIKCGSDGEKGFNIHVELPLTKHTGEV